MIESRNVIITNTKPHKVMTKIPKILIGTLLVFWLVVITNSCFGQAERTKVNTNQSWKYFDQAPENTKEAVITSENRELKNDDF